MWATTQVKASLKLSYSQSCRVFERDCSARSFVLRHVIPVAIGLRTHGVQTKTYSDSSPCSSLAMRSWSSAIRTWARSSAGWSTSPACTR
jgi:hypothetical protein